MPNTIKQTIECSKGTVTLVITETPEVVYMGIEGPQTTDPQDLAKIYRAMLPLIGKYEDDDRPLEISGGMGGFTSHVETAGDVLIASVKPNKTTD